MYAVCAGNQLSNAVAIQIACRYVSDEHHVLDLRAVTPKQLALMIEKKTAVESSAHQVFRGAIDFKINHMHVAHYDRVSIKSERPQLYLDLGMLKDGATELNTGEIKEKRTA